MENALIIFVRNPVLGRVKTRIAEAVGEKKALDIYLELLRHTHDIVHPLAADKYIFYSENPEPGDIWEDHEYYKFLQSGETLGDKMQDAIQRLLAMGYEKVCIIGSDCYELTTGIIESAFEILSGNDIVIGPAKDGGYYLMGMKKVVLPIFSNKEWSTATVYSKTINDLENSGYSYSTLPMLNDVDTMEDVPEELLNQKKTF